MNDKDLELMRELTETHAPPGFEARMHHVMKKHLEPLTGGNLVTDHLGGITGKHGNTGPKVLVAGHLDEVGMMVNQITEDGFLRFQTLGGWWGHVMLAQRVKVLTRKGDYTGVIGSKAPHVIPPEERKKVLEPKTMFIDIGATSKKEAEEFGVEVGDPIVPVCPFEVLANPKMLLGKAWDNRMGCYVALKTLESLVSKEHPNTIFCGATVQEEVGLRGAQTLVQTIAPDIAFAVDVGVAGDTPGMDPKDGLNKLGQGPMLGFFDGSMIPHLKLRDFVVNAAKENGIPYQIGFMPGGGTDAGRFHTAFQGIPTMVIGVAARYIHSNVSVIHRDDLDQAVQLLTLIIQKLDSDSVTRIKGLDGRLHL
jgi:putative aminopeptidase FrvX